MKLKLLESRLNLIIDSPVPGGGLTPLKILKKNNFTILETFGVYLETNVVVSGLTASYGTYTDRIELQWEPVEGVTYYNIYKNKTDFLTQTTGTTYTDTNQIAGVIAEYFVKTLSYKDGFTYIGKPSYVYGWKQLKAPVILPQVDIVRNRVTLTYSSIEGATAYKLFKVDGSDTSKLALYGITTFDFIVDRSVKYGELYSYAVKASSPLSDSQLSNTLTLRIAGNIPNPPTNIIASTGEYYDRIRVTWNSNPFDGAEFYNIYKNGTTTKIATVPNTSTVFDDFFVVAETQNQYFVSAQNLNGETEKVSSNFGWKRISIPTNFNASKASFTDKIFLSWNPVEGATGYTVYKGSPLSQYQTLTGTTLIDTSVVYGNTYGYAIKSIGSLTQSELSPTSIGFLRQSVPEFAPSGITASDGEFTDKILIQWNPVSSIQGVSGYKLYRNQAQIVQLTDTEFSDTTIIPGITFEYAVKAFNAAGNGITSAGNTGWIGLIEPQNLTASKNLTDRINLNWNLSNGATEYNVYTATSFFPPVNVVLLGTTANTSFTDFTPTFGQNYRYAVKASCQLGESDYSFEAIGSVAQSAPEFAPTGVSASDGAFTDAINITWNPVSTIQGVSGYSVLKNGNVFTNTSGTNTSDTTAIPGTTFEYSVRAFNKAGFGPISAGNTGWIKLSPPANFFASKSVSLSEIRLNWSSSTGATRYEVFKGSSPASLTGITQTTNQSYIDSGLSSGISFTYAVKALCDLGVSDLSSTDIGETGTPIPVPDPPTGVSASDGAFADRVDITWNSVPGISGYIIFRDSSQIGVTTAESFIDTPSPGVIFNYEVAARNSSGIGNTGAGNTGWRALSAPTNLSATTIFPDRVDLAWTTVTGATAYKIFTFHPDNTNVSLIGTTTGFAFSDFTPTFGVGYTYSIKASCSLGDSEFSTAVKGSVIQSPPETAPQNFQASDGVHTDKIALTWNPVTSIQGISGYKIFRNENFLDQASKTATRYEDVLLSSGTSGFTFNYRINAFNSAGDGPTSLSNTGWKKLTPPGNVTTANSTDRITLVWTDSFGNIDNFKIFTAKDFITEEGLSLIGSPGKQIGTFDHFGPTYGVAYKYAIKASGPLGDSDYSPETVGEILQSPPETAPTGICATNGEFNNKVTVSWIAPTTTMGISSFNVYKTNSAGVQTIQVSSGTPFDDFTGTAGLTFSYTVSAVNLAGEGPISSSDIGWKGLSAPTQFDASDGLHQNKISLSWSSIHGPEISYKIYKGLPLQGITTTTNTFFDDTEVLPGSTAQYAVSAFTSSNIESALSNVNIGYLGLCGPAGLSATVSQFTDKVRLNWTDVEGAPAYRLYRGTDTTLLTTVSGVTLFDDTTVTPGLNFDYYVSTFIPDVAHESNKVGPIIGRRKLSPPTGFTASRGLFGDKVAVSWTGVSGATAYKVFKATSFSPPTGLTLLGVVTVTAFDDFTATGGNQLEYAAKSSTPVEDSEFSNVAIGYTDNLYSEVVNMASQIQNRYTERNGSVYLPAPPRLQPWTGALHWNPQTAKQFIEGVTAIPGKMSGITKDVNIYDNFVQFYFEFGMRGNSVTNNTLGVTAYSKLEKLTTKYDPGSFWINLQGVTGITLREGELNTYFRPKSWNELAITPFNEQKLYPSVLPTNLQWTSAKLGGGLTWANQRNKLHHTLWKMSDLQAKVFDDVLDLATAWRFMLAMSNGCTAQRGLEAVNSVYKSDLNARIQTQDYLNVIKTVLTELKNHYPLAIPQNEIIINGSGVENQEINNVTWFGRNTGRAYLGMSGGFRKGNPPIGATLDIDFWTGRTVDTWSPEGFTADQGDYLYDSWKRDRLVSAMYMLQGITTARNPEGISGGQLLTDDPSWNLLFKDLRTLLFKELRDHVKHIWERRAWYMVVNSGSGRDFEFDRDIDNLGWIQGNQWIDPLASVIKIAMYLYPFAETDLERKAILAAYNICTEHFAGFLERAMFVGTDPDKAGPWTEGFGYAAQSYPPILNVLVDMKRMGDRRLWDTVSKRGQGITYSCWINNAWKWMYSRIMPNEAIVNAGSCDSSDYGGGSGNSYHRSGWPHEHAAILASEYPIPGTTGSAISETFNIIRKISGGSWRGGTVLMHEYKKYAEAVANKSPRQFSRGNHFPDDQTTTWVSDFIIPIEQDERTKRGYSYAINDSITVPSVPFVFGLWTKGSGKFDGKGHRDEGHVSAYMGTAPILIELGEIRADTSNSRILLEREQSGHNIMQLGAYRKSNHPRQAKISGLVLGETGGSVFMDLSRAYNQRSLTGASQLDPPFSNATHTYAGGIVAPWGHDPFWNEIDYSYQIGKVTRKIDWQYEPYSPVSSLIKITDFAGISGICAGVSGPTDRVYYRFNVGYQKQDDPRLLVLGDPNFTIDSVAGTNNKVWNIGWKQGITFNKVEGYTCDFVGVTMTISADQPINILQKLVAHRSTKEAHSLGNNALFANQFKNYAIDITLNTGFTDPNKLNLVTEIRSTIFGQTAGVPLTIPTETPIIQNYRTYTLNSTASLPVAGGCSLTPPAPTHVFPRWDVKISKTPGIAFGQILVRDFVRLAPAPGFTLPNALWTC